MNILYLCDDPGIDVAGKGGAAVHIRSLARALADLGHKVAAPSHRKEVENEHR